jgi:hypothetical protein
MASRAGVCVVNDNEAAFGAPRPHVFYAGESEWRLGAGGRLVLDNGKGGRECAQPTISDVCDEPIRP